MVEGLGLDGMVDRGVGLERGGGNRGGDERDGVEMGKRVDHWSFQQTEVWGN